LVVCREKARIDHGLCVFCGCWAGRWRELSRRRARSRSKYVTSFKGAKGACLKTLWARADQWVVMCRTFLWAFLQLVRTTTHDFRRTQRTQPPNDLPLFFRWVLGGSPSWSQTCGVGAPCLCWPCRATQVYPTA
jgi:hypothetical protein